MRALADAIVDREIRVANPAGTDLVFRTQGRLHVNDGDASRARSAGARSARDREAEIPCGALRALPVLDTVEGEIVFRGGYGWPVAGYGLDIDKFIGDGLRIVFEKGRVRRLETSGDQKALDRAFAEESGDKDRLGEFVLGCNPLLTPVEGTGFRPYYGFGDGVIRLTLGENIESGGANRASLHRWLFLTDGSVSVGGRAIVHNGAIVRPIL
jgi:leucyl aminopeptidase (aminopeptidase T)